MRPLTATTDTRATPAYHGAKYDVGCCLKHSDVRLCSICKPTADSSKHRYNYVRKETNLTESSSSDSLGHDEDEGIIDAGCDDDNFKRRHSVLKEEYRPQRIQKKKISPKNKTSKSSTKVRTTEEKTVDALNPDHDFDVSIKPANDATATKQGRKFLLNSRTDEELKAARANVDYARVNSTIRVYEQIHRRYGNGNTRCTGDRGGERKQHRKSNEEKKSLSRGITAKESKASSSAKLVRKESSTTLSNNIRTNKQSTRQMTKPSNTSKAKNEKKIASTSPSAAAADVSSSKVKVSSKPNIKSTKRYDLPFNSTTGTCNVHQDVHLAVKNPRGGWRMVLDFCPKCTA